MLLLLLAACLGKPHERPWYADYVEIAAIDVRYDADEMIRVLWYDVGGQLHLGTLDPRAEVRAVADDGAITDEGGAPVTVSEFGPAGWSAMAIRPGRGDVWLFDQGRVGPVHDGVMSVKWTYTGMDTETKGSLVFVDEDTLVVSTDAGAVYEGRGTLVFDVSGDELGEPASFEVTTPDGGIQVIGGICRFDHANGFMTATGCEGGTATIALESRSLVPSPGGGSDDEILVAASAAGGAIGEGGGIGFQGDFNTNYCALPWADGALVVEKSRYAQEGICRGSNVLLPPIPFGDIRDDNAAWVAGYTGSALVLVDKHAPKGEVGDIEGTWCAMGGGGSLTLHKGEPPVYAQGSESIFRESSWSRSGDKLKMSFLDDSFESSPDEHLEHWAVRVNNTLNIKTGTDSEMRDHMQNAGYQSFDGLWARCGD